MISSRFVAGNLLDRQFTAEAPNQRWVGDTTEFVIGESGKLYLAAILDLYSRFIVGWAVSAVNDRHLTIKALEMALKRRCPEVGLLHHSDQGARMRVKTTRRSSRHTASRAV
jgi:transposase InsO family protein